MNQEPGTPAEIKAFIKDLYGGEWPIFEKIEVNGPNSHEVFKFCRIHSELHNKEKKEVKEIPWNFAKFLIDSNGQVVSYHNPRVEPLAMEKEIVAMLNKGFWKGWVSYYCCNADALVNTLSLIDCGY